MTTLTLTNVSQDLASLELAGRRVYIERPANLRGRLRSEGKDGHAAGRIIFSVCGLAVCRPSHNTFRLRRSG